MTSEPRFATVWADRAGTCATAPDTRPRMLPLPLPAETPDAALAVAIIGHSDDAIVAKTLDGIVLSWNGGAERLFGYPAGEMIGSSITRLFPADRMFEEAELIAKVQAGGSIDHFETKRLRKDGSIVDVSVCLSAIRDPSGTIVAIAKTARDITERVRLRSQLDDLSADMARILDHSSAAVSLWNPDGTNRFANLAYAQTFGFTPESIRGRHVSEVLGARLYAEVRPGIERALAGERYAYERELELPFGRRRTLSIEYLPDLRRQVDGRPGLFVFVHDITVIRDAERESREREAAENASRMKSEFLARMSHELRTPLNAILGFAQLLSAGMSAANATRKQLDQLREIEAAGWHLSKLVDEVLDFTRIEAGGLALDLASIDVGEAVGRAIATEAPRATAQQVVVTFDAAAGPHKAYVRADETRLQQILLNLLSNAIKYNRPGGHVQVEIGPPAGSFVDIRIRDTGIGMSEEQMRHLFEPFQRLGMERTRTTGSGMGLVVSRLLAERMGGQILVSSVAGAGSEFTVRLPAAA